MDVRDLPADQTTDENVGMGPDLARQREEFLAARMSPPTAAPYFAEYLVCQIRDSAIARRLEHDSVLLDEANGLFFGHLELGCLGQRR